MKRLRLVLMLNGASCVLFGLLFLLASSSVSAFLADRAAAPAAIILVLGAGLLINGLALFFVARSNRPNRHAVWFFSVGDLLWVLATLVLIATGVWIDRAPAILAALAVAVFVGTVGWLQWRAIRAQPT
ncbi:MAG TPA: hypothetical protein VKO85_07680 [Wenzhouxiangellaceae bacterium]|nr:hypothetical protein [Wenzhouxiangellaceae bacterium]